MAFSGTMSDQFPPVTRNLIIANVIIYALGALSPQMGYYIYYYLPMYYFRLPEWHIYQLITSMFVHANFEHLLFNMFGLWMFGRTIEYVMGPKRFFNYYLICGIGAAIIQQIVFNGQAQSLWQAYGSDMNLPLEGFMVVGASGAVFGLLMAFGYLFPNSMILVMFMIPMKAKYFVILYGLIELFSGISNQAGDNVAHFAHLGGALFGYIMLKVWKYRPLN